MSMTNPSLSNYVKFSFKLLPASKSKAKKSSLETIIINVKSPTKGTRTMLDFIRVNTHSSIRTKDEKVIYIDPFKIENAVKDADIFRENVTPEITVVEKIEKY